MKLSVPKEFTGTIQDAEGAAYPVVDGVVDIPDSKVTDSHFGYGFARIIDEPAKPSKYKEALNQD